MLTKLLLTVSCCLSLFSGGDDETLQEFKKYFRKYTDSATRVEAILALDSVEDPGVVDVLVPLLGDADPLIVDATRRVLSTFKTGPPIVRLVEVLEKAKKEPERVGLLGVLREGGYTPLGEPVHKCLLDKAWTVRRGAIEALVASREEGVVARLVPMCADKEIAVRCAALDGLAALAADEVRAPAVAALTDQAWQVRASAIAALGLVRHTSSIPPLLERLELEEGRLKADAAAALDRLTGRNFGTRLELWKQFWASYGERYQIPTDEELATLRAKQAARKAEYQGAPGSTVYHGVDSPSRRIVFVIDVSGSMEDEVVDKERFAGTQYPSWSRMDIVKTELARTIEALESYVEFQIIAFATETKSWKKDLVPANVLNKSSAIDFVKRLAPLGGNSKSDLASAGLTGAANLEAGKTNTYAALADALRLEAGTGTREAYAAEIDTIFFLSDGMPTVGTWIDTEDILREVREGNALRKIVLHTIAIGRFDKIFMQRLASENGGVFVDLGG
ncbi:MAG: HEAT repeat domain-containing protein [Planctomycetota bacterium]